MKLWTIQKEEAWTKIQEKGYLGANSKIVKKESFYFFGKDILFPIAYQFIADSMKKRKIYPDHPRRKYPIWLWHTYGGERKRRDLRSVYHSPGKVPLIQLEVEVPENEVLLSNFDLYHWPLNGLPIFDTEEEENEFESEMIAAGLKRTYCDLWTSTDPKFGIFKYRIKQTWEKIFDTRPYSPVYLKKVLDLDLSVQPLQKDFIEESLSIQANCWRIEKDQILKVDHFKSRGEKSKKK